MHRITKIEVIATDPKTGAIVKQIHTTAGTFLSRVCAFNQTFERFEKTMLNYEENGKNPFPNAPPITINTLRYLLTTHPKSPLLSIKELTASRLSEEQIEYRKEVDRLKRIALTNKRVVLFYAQIPVGDWEEYTIEDVLTIVMLQIDAELPHVTLPTHRLQSAEENKKLIEKAKKKLHAGQNILGQLHTDMKKRDGKHILDAFFMDDKIFSVVLTGLSPNPSHLFYYSYCWTNAPKGKLVAAADVQDTFGNSQQKLPTHHALRRFQFDITCRRVTFPVGMKFDFPTPPSKNYIYDDVVGGMLTEADQITWHGRSTSDFIMQDFPANTGLDFREYVLAFNFHHLNRTGRKEAEAIIKHQHEVYIKKRVFIKSYWNSLSKYGEKNE